MTGTYEFAGIPIQITCLHAQTLEMCSDYQTDKAPMYSFEVTQKDIDAEYELAKTQEPQETDPPKVEDRLEALALYRKMAEALSMEGVVLLHGSALSYQGKGVVFSAKSGTGKSTHAALWRKAFGADVTMVNDDKPLLRVTAEGIFVYGTPWDGKHRLSQNICVPLCAYAELTRSETNTVHTIEPMELYFDLLSHSYRPTEPEHMQAMLASLDQIITRVRGFSLGVNMADEAALTARDAMIGTAPAEPNPIKHVTASFEDVLSSGTPLAYTVTGASMTPMLRAKKDIVVIRPKKDELCKVGDVILFRSGKRYILHRVHAVTESGYITAGDHCYTQEQVPEADVLGILESYVRGGSTFRMDDPDEIAYAEHMVRTYRARARRLKTKYRVLRALADLYHRVIGK